MKGGINIASYAWKSDYKRHQKETYNSKFKPNVLFHVGAVANYALTEEFSLQGGLAISGKGYKETWIDDDDDGGSSSGEKNKTSHSMFYLEIPINAVYHYKNFYVGAGPYFGYGLMGTWKWSAPGDSDSGNLFEKDDYGYSRADFGAKIQAGYRLNEKISLGLDYGIGLTKLERDWDNSPKNSVLSLSVSYWF
ncbi:MAG: PorT family protein [Chitinophagaceae bacterium]|nr:PorT family protein [Chitinophagaceae bacterium]